MDRRHPGAPVECNGRLAVPVYFVSLVSMVATAVYNFALSDGLKVMGTAGALFTAVIFASAAALLMYARAMRKRGVLR